MKRQKGEKLMLKDISVADQKTMGLDWMWKAGASATYIREYGHDHYHGVKKPCSLVTVSHLRHGELRELWVFNMFLKAACIWN